MSATRQQLLSRHIQLVTIDAKDSATYDITGPALQQAVAVAREARLQSGALLVQCWGGCNRAPGIAVGLLMCLDHMDVVAACNRVAQVRGEVLTNHAFRLQLVQAAMRMGLLPDFRLRDGLPATEPAQRTWDTKDPEELLELLWASRARGTGLEQTDETGRAFGAYLQQAVASKNWTEHGRLMRRLTVMRGLLAASNTTTGV